MVVGGAEMGEEIGTKALETLGMGFDLTSDFRLLYAKDGRRANRLVELDESFTRDVVIPGGFVIRGVQRDVACDKGDRIRFRSDILEFNQMSELLNQKSSIHGKVPSGYFNSLFDLTGIWLDDALDTKYLAFDGYFISLYNLHLTASPLVLRNEVKEAVPSKWDPVALSRFIETYGTHIIVGLSVGGQDVVTVRQMRSSSISPADLKLHLEDLGDFLFSDGRSPSPVRRSREGKHKVPEVFNKILLPNAAPMFASSIRTETKEGITITCSKRGGDLYSSSHSEWLQQVSRNPDGILFKFVPITSLLTGIQGSGYLSHAINLYLRYKPPREDLQYFLEFQVPQQWAPMFNELALGPQRKKASFPALHFTCFSPKLLVNTTQVDTGEKPVIGLRLYLEGKNCNRLAIHVQHLSNFPSMFDLSRSNASSSVNYPKRSRWHESDDSNPGYLESIKWKNYSRVCTATVEADSSWYDTMPNGVFVVTGAQLFTKGKWNKKSLHLRLHFTHIPNCRIQKTQLAVAPVAEQRSSFLSNLSTTFIARDAPPKQETVQMNSGVYPDGPPVPVQSKKLLKYVDVAEVTRGPHDHPGHWLVTAAKLVKENGKIGLHVHFALLYYLSTNEM